MGYDAIAAAEFEFFLFDETPDRVREKGFRDLNDHDAGLLRLLDAAQLGARRVLSRAARSCAGACAFPIEGLHTETGPGVLEAAIQYDEALEAADRAALFKTFTKVLAQRHGLMATFMAKWSKDWPGQSGHLHVSLARARAAQPAFHDPTKPHTHVGRDALVRRRPAGADAGIAGHGRLAR